MNLTELKSKITKEVVKKYFTSDAKEFNSYDDAFKHELKINKIKDLRHNLDFQEGDILFFLDLNSASIKKVKVKWIEESLIEYPDTKLLVQHIHMKDTKNPCPTYTIGAADNMCLYLRKKIEDFLDFDL